MRVCTRAMFSLVLVVLIWLIGCTASPIDTSLLRAARYARSPYMLEVRAAGSTDAVPGLREVEAAALSIAKQIAPDESPTFDPQRARRFTVQSPDEGTFDYYAVGVIDSTMTSTMSATAVNAYAIHRAGKWAVWAEIVGAAPSGVSATFVVERPGGEVARATEQDFRTTYLGLSAKQPLSLQSAAPSLTCTIVNDVCEFGLQATAGYLCDASTVVSTVAVVSCVAAIFDDGTTLGGCAVVLVEKYAEGGICKLLDAVKGPIVTATCDALVGCGLSKLGLGCDCGWKDPRKKGCRVACSSLVDAAYCSGVNLTASTVAAANDAVGEICRADPVCEAVWDVGCGQYAESLGPVSGTIDVCTGVCQIELADPTCGRVGQPCCAGSQCGSGATCSNEICSDGSSCGDGSCAGAETCSSCPADCGACPPRCGDGTCNGSETCSSCPADCGACPPRCGDGTCNGSETCSSCPADCGACLPDLSITSFSPPSAVGIGTCYNIPVTVSRSGGALSNGTYALVRVYLSTDTTITTSDYQCSFDVNTSSRFSNDNLNMSGSVSQNVFCCPGDPSLPGTVTKGTTYHWSAIVDPTNFYPESNEGNNVIAGGAFVMM